MMLSMPLPAIEIPTSARAALAAQSVQPTLEAMRDQAQVRPGAPLLVRIFKSEDELEIWADAGTRYVLLRTYPICMYSGALGPKIRQGDGQAPEGFYAVSAQLLNPSSRFHLSFNLGYPNAFDRAHERSGDFLMVHGNCVSIGCYAMGDVAIEEIYTLLAQALAAGQAQVPVHAFPFRFRDGWREAHADNEWLDFWSQLEAGYQAFEKTHRPPKISVKDGRYVAR